MASIAGKTHLFFTTSPRTPNKMKDEVRLLIEQFNGQIWEGNEQVQANYFRKLLQADFYEDGRQDDGNTADKDLALAARDRIT